MRKIPFLRLCLMNSTNNYLNVYNGFEWKWFNMTNDIYTVHITILRYLFVSLKYPGYVISLSSARKHSMKLPNSI